MERTLLIVDDSPDFAEAARDLLSTCRFRVVGIAGDGRLGLRMVDELTPDVVVVDIGLPDLDGFEVTRRLTGRQQSPDVVLISSRDWSDLPRRIAESGARGFLGKEQLDAAAIEALLDDRIGPPR